MAHCFEALMWCRVVAGSLPPHDSRRQAGLAVRVVRIAETPREASELIASTKGQLVCCRLTVSTALTVTPPDFKRDDLLSPDASGTRFS